MWWIAFYQKHNILYNEEQTFNENNNYKYYIEENGEDVPYTSSGYVARDEEGNAIRDEEGNLVRRLYSLEQVEADNDLFGIASEGLAIFKVAIEFRLTDTGMKVSIPRESLVDSTNVEEKVSPEDADYELIKGDYVITNAQICPYITEVDETQKGYMIIPDGSGAVINFNNNKTSNVSTKKLPEKYQLSRKFKVF